MANSEKEKRGNIENYWLPRLHHSQKKDLCTQATGGKPLALLNGRERERRGRENGWYVRDSPEALIQPVKKGVTTTLKKRERDGEGFVLTQYRTATSQ